MISYWNTLVAREKILIGIALALFSILLGWFLLLKPMLAYPAGQKNIWEGAQSDLAIMRQGQLSLTDTQIPSALKQSLSTTDAPSKITKSALEHGLIISRRQANGDSGYSLWFETAQSTQFYKWMDDLSAQYAITFLRVSVNRNDDGSVRAQVTFKLGT